MRALSGAVGGAARKLQPGRQGSARAGICADAQEPANGIRSILANPAAGSPIYTLYLESDASAGSGSRRIDGRPRDNQLGLRRSKGVSRSNSCRCAAGDAGKSAPGRRDRRSGAIEARTYTAAEFHGLVIENTHDRPYLKFLRVATTPTYAFPTAVWRTGVSSSASWQHAVIVDSLAAFRECHLSARPARDDVNHGACTDSSAVRPSGNPMLKPRSGTNPVRSRKRTSDTGARTPFRASTCSAWTLGTCSFGTITM